MKTLTASLFFLPFAATAATLTGQWDFSNPANLGEATVGNDLIMEGTAPTHSAALADDSLASLNGVITTVNGGANRIRADHGIAPNGGSFVNQYSIVTDIFSPAGSRGSWRTIYQTNTSNGNDGDFFIRPDNDGLGVGDLGYSGSPIDESAWTRLVLTVDLTQAGGDVNSYLDGALHFAHPGDPAIDGRFSLDPFFYLFTDNDGDAAPLNVGMVAVYSGVLTPGQVASLGAAGSPVPEPSSALLLVLASAIGLRRRR